MLLGGLGVGAAAYGAWMLLDDSFSDLVWIVVWLGAGVLLHDAVLAPLTGVAATVSHRWLPEVARGPVVVGAVVLVPLTLLSVPVLGRFGASPGNPTLLDRDYVAGWAGVAALTGAGVAMAVVVRIVRRNRGARAGR